jgi:hypothetical protein
MRIALLTALAMLALAAPESASGATATVVNTTVIVNDLASGGETNKVELTTGTGALGVFTVVENGSGLGMDADNGCSVKSSTVAECDVLITDGFGAMQEGDDELHNNTPLPFQIFGGRGADKLFGGEASDVLGGNEGKDEVHGAGGNDVLRDDGGIAAGSGGDDKLFGDAGDDLMMAGTRGPDETGGGGDTFDGGPGTDTADYSERTVPQRLSEDALANDGQGAAFLAEHDNIVNAEVIVGGSAGDDIGGGAPANTLRGGDGDDELDGGSGPDRVLGEEGDDLLDGGPDGDLLSGGHGRDAASYANRIKPVTATLDGAANDGAGNESDRIDDDVENLAGGFVDDDLTGSGGPNRIRGNDGDDTLKGAAGDDAVEGGEGEDTVSGGSGDDLLAGGDGDDTIAARDLSKDSIACGNGVDAVAADPFDAVAADCEKVSRGTGALSLPKTIDVSAKRVATVRVGCPAKAYGGCRRGALTLRAKGTKVASAPFTIGAGDSAKVQLRLSSKGLATLRSRRPRSLRATSPGAGPATESVTVKLP